jgi:hypothetical protein
MGSSSRVCETCYALYSGFQSLSLPGSIESV